MSGVVRHRAHTLPANHTAIAIAPLAHGYTAMGLVFFLSFIIVIIGTLIIIIFLSISGFMVFRFNTLSTKALTILFAVLLTTICFLTYNHQLVSAYLEFGAFFLRGIFRT